MNNWPRLLPTEKALLLSSGSDGLFYLLQLGKLCSSDRHGADQSEEIDEAIEPRRDGFPAEGGEANPQGSIPSGGGIRWSHGHTLNGYSNPAMEEALYDVPMLRRFAGLDAFEDVMPDESAILRFQRCRRSMTWP